MLVLRSVKLKNFLSHPETVLEFAGERRVLIDGKSGAGKSGIVEAVIWGLYGKGRADNRFLVRSGEEKGEVELLLQNGDTHYRVTRAITVSGKQAVTLESSNDGEEYEPVQVTGIKGAQEWIENSLLHASYTLFINSIAYPQDNSDNFVKQSASKRKDLLLEIAGSTDFDTYYNRAKDKLALEEEALARISGRLEDKKTVAKMGAGLKEKISDYQGKIERSEATLIEKRKETEALNTILVQLRDVDRRMASLNEASKRQVNTITGIQNTIKNAEIKVNEINALNLEELEAKAKILTPLATKTRLNELRAVTEKAAEWNKLMGEVIRSKPREYDYTTDIQNLTREMMQIVRGTDTHCPALNNQVCDRLEKQLQTQTAYFEEQIVQKRALREKQEKELGEYTKLIESMGVCPVVDWEGIKAAEQEMADYHDLTNRIFAARATKESLSGYEGALIVERERLVMAEKDLLETKKEIMEVAKLLEGQNLSMVEGKNGVLQNEILQIEREIRDFTGLVAESKAIFQMATEALAAIQELDSQASGHRERIEALKAVKEAFGSKGIKTVVIDYFVPKLEERINEVLSQLSEFRVEIDTQREGSDEDSVIEGLFINIIDSRGQIMEFNSYSGGEKLKVIVSISEALSSLQNTGFRILDELFVGLDQESTDGFAEVLGKVQNRFQQMICVSHLQSIKDMFDDRVEVVKLNGLSSIA